MKSKVGGNSILNPFKIALTQKWTTPKTKLTHATIWTSFPGSDDMPVGPHRIIKKNLESLDSILSNLVDGHAM